MNLQKLISTREAHRKLAERQLQKMSPELSSEEISVILDVLTGKAATIKQLNEKILSQTDVADIETEINDSEEYLLHLEEKIRKIRREFMSRRTAQVAIYTEHIDTLVFHDINQHSIQRQVSLQTQPSATSTMSQHRFPKLTLPTFNGNILLWQTFCNLKYVLEDASARDIDGFPITKANYTKTVDLLRELIGQPHKIVCAYMQAFMDLPRLTTNIHSLRTFCDNLESYIRGLESLGQCQDSYGNLLVPVIFEKIPAIIRNIKRDHDDSNWQLPILREALKKEISIKEAGQPVERPEVHDAIISWYAGSTSKPTVPNNKQPSTNHRLQSKLCPFCSGSHEANDCRKVTSVTSRVEIIYVLIVSKITRFRIAFRCRHCQRKHHYSICDRQSANSTPGSRVTTTTSSESVTSGATGHSTILHSTTQPRSNVLLKTAVAQVCSERCCADANILFDEGAQRSFITKSMVDISQLERTGTDVVHLMTFGATTQNVRHFDTATVYLSTDNGEKIPINVLEVTTIAVPLHNLQHSVTSLPHLRAHPVTDNESFEI